jgi:hypothetical protein
MAYPSLEQYNQAFQLHSRLLADVELKSGTVTTTGLGLPLAISGGFALTYTITAGAKKYAVRCFHRESKALERRYVAISKRLAGLGSPYFLDFQFQPQGIRVDGAGYPIVKMAWAKGETLGEFLEAKHGDLSSLTKLSNALLALSGFLDSERIAHGDLQTGNLMVSGGGAEIQLIDYDGMYVDEIKDIGSTELGQVNFQHPQRRSTNPFGPGLDRFSLIALTVSLKALRADPSLWRKTNSEVDAILFRANDFTDPGASQTFALLAANPDLATDAKNFALVCKAPMDKAPSLADFLAGRRIPAGLVALTGTGHPSAQKASYFGAYSVLLAIDYETCLRRVGDRVEVIGCIVDVNANRARNGKPYVFINFGDWRGKIFKVAIWSDGLAAQNEKPDSGWVGKWLSVVGLMEPPYVNPKFKYSHLSINVTAVGQMTLIPESDAQWRMASSGNRAPSFATSSNQDALDRIKGRSSSSTARPLPSNAASTVTSASEANRAAMDRIRSATRSVPPSSTTHISHAPNTGRPPQPASSYQGAWEPPPSEPPRKKGLGERIFNWLFG